MLYLSKVTFYKMVLLSRKAIISLIVYHKKNIYMGKLVT